ncbi:hypothetical protein PAEPH01_1151 [Pancytospora epiphaga]|nr:hypothetical protein PAEPH01_1151 [Pancytospora epiphaga]
MQTYGSSGTSYLRRRISFLAPVKLICLAISAYSLDVVTYTAKSASEAKAIEIRGYLYFTNISLLYTLFTVFMGMLSKLNKPFHTIHAFSVATALILEFIVTITFWPLFLINPMLIKNKSDLIEMGGPSYIGELPKHAFPALILLIEQAELQITKQWSHRFFFLGFSVMYYIASETYTAKLGLYLYPFLKNLSALSRLIFFSAISLVALCMYELFFGLRTYWRLRVKVKTKEAEMPKSDSTTL